MSKILKRNEEFIRHTFKKSPSINDSVITQAQKSSLLHPSDNSQEGHRHTLPIQPLHEDELIPSWKMLRFSDKSMLFSYWNVLIMIGDVLVFLSCVLHLFDTRHIHRIGDIMLGIGGLLLWVTMLKYYDTNKGYNIVLNTLSNSSEIILKALIGTLPVFIGFAVLGMCLFWSSKRFNGLSSAMFSLFALMNGDGISDVNQDLVYISYGFGQVFIYLFCSFSILVILNVFISIIEDGYFISKTRLRNDWIKRENIKATDNSKL